MPRPSRPRARARAVRPDQAAGPPGADGRKGWGSPTSVRELQQRVAERAERKAEENAPPPSRSLHQLSPRPRVLLAARHDDSITPRTGSPCWQTRRTRPRRPSASGGAEKLLDQLAMLGMQADIQAFATEIQSSMQHYVRASSGSFSVTNGACHRGGPPSSHSRPGTSSATGEAPAFGGRERSCPRGSRNRTGRASRSRERSAGGYQSAPGDRGF